MVWDGGRQLITISDGAQVDAFGRLRTGQPFGVYESKLISTRKREHWEERLWGVILAHGTVTGPAFVVGNTVTGGTSGMTGTITAVGTGNITVSVKNNDWTDGETLTSATSSAALTTHNTGADLTYNYYSASCTLSVGTVIGQRVVRQTDRYFPYVAGYSQLINMTETFGAAKVGLRQTVMYGDDLNGYGLVLDNLTLNILLRTNTSGTAVDTLIPQSTWNIDKLDGTGNSRVTLDPTKSQISGFDFQWLGVGRRRVALNIDGQLIAVHAINHANHATGVYMRTPTLPVRYEIENKATTASASSLEQICCSVMSEAGYALPGEEFSVSHTWAQERTISTRAPVLALRLKTAFPTGQPNRRQLRYLDIQGFTRLNDTMFELVHVHNPLTMTATWADVDTGSSGAEYSVDISALTAEHFHVVQHLHVPASAGDKSNAVDITSEMVNQHSYVTQNFESDNSQMFVIYATSRTASAAVCAHFAFLESE